MQLQSQIMRENTRVLTDVQDVTSDASIHMPVTSTPRKQPQKDVSRVSRSTYNSPAYSGPVYTTPLSRSLPSSVPKTDKATQTKPKRTLAATFCGYPSEEEEDLV